MSLKSGDDDLFVNQIATKKNAIICTLEDSFTESLPKTSFKSWFKQKKRHVSTASRYRALHKFLLGLFYLSQFLFWSVGILLIAFLYNWKIVLGLIILRFLVQYVCFFKSSRKLKEQDLIILLPVLEVFLIVVQLVIFMSNLTTKNSRWN
jgi:hypothetical protein